MYGLFIAAVVLIGGGISGAIVVTAGTDAAAPEPIATTTTAIELVPITSVPGTFTSDPRQAPSTVVDGLSAPQMSVLRSQAQETIDAENARLNNPLNVPGCGLAPYANAPSGEVRWWVDLPFPLTTATADSIQRELTVLKGDCLSRPLTGGPIDGSWTNPYSAPGTQGVLGMMALDVDKSDLDAALARVGLGSSTCQREARWALCGITSDEELDRLRGG